MLKFFRVPFALSGTRTPVPDTADPSGFVSYIEGYGTDYQRAKADPLSKNIERDKMNQILFDATTAIGELQAQGAPDFITTALNGGSPFPYSKNAVAKYSDGSVYVSLVDANTALPTDETKWAKVFTAAASVFDSQKNYNDATEGAALTAIVRVTDFPYLARSNGTNDDTAAIQAAITWAAQAFDADWFSATIYARPRVVKLGRTHKVLGKILVPRGVVIDMSDTTIIGNGSNQVFETAYFNSGVLTTNIGTPAESHRVQYTRFLGGRFVNCGKVFNLYNFNEGCEVRGAAFTDCVQAVVAERAFYAEFSNLTSRGSASGSTAWCFDFGFFVNVERIVGVVVVDRVNPMRFQGAVNGLRLDVAAENCTNGISFTGEVNPVYIGAGSYFESITNTGIDLSTASAHRAVEINGAFFNGVATAVKGVQMISGQIGPNNYYTSVTTKVDIQDFLSFITVHMEPKAVATNVSLLPTMPADYLLSRTVRAQYPQVIVSEIDGSAQARAITPADHFVELPWFGRSGRVPQKVLWCNTALVNTGGTNYNVEITTKIAYDVDVGLFFSFTVNDDIGSYKICGNAAGPTIYASSLAGKTATISVDGSGYVKITLSSFSHPSGSISATGQIRMQ